MLDSYRRILAVPGAPAFSAAALVARLPISMLGLGFVLLVSEETGSYAKAGVISAVAVIANAVGAPLQGRLTDRFGQHRVLPATSALFGLGLALGLLAISQGAPTPSLTRARHWPASPSRRPARWYARAGRTTPSRR